MYRRFATSPHAFEVATGTVTDACYARHRSDEFLSCLKLIARTYPRVTLHVMDNDAHKHPRSTPGSNGTRGSPVHLTPTGGSWLNLVEVFFSIITRQAIRRGTYTSVLDLIAAVHTFIDGWNNR